MMFGQDVFSSMANFALGDEELSLKRRRRDCTECSMSDRSSVDEDVMLMMKGLVDSGLASRISLTHLR